MFWFRTVLVVGLLIQTLIVDAGTRAVWVTRWNFKSPEDVAKIMENCKSIGANKILFQVRGNGTVYYPSKIEPWAYGLASDDFSSLGVDPGWDPLRVAIDEAHKRNLELHAWLNIFPGWRGKEKIPSRVNQLWRTKREWFMIDHKGKVFPPPAQFYTFLSPGIRDVQLYLGSIFGELARNYKDLDGIHMDYVRYPAHTETGSFKDFSYDKESKANYRKQYGKFPRYDDPDWQRFKVQQVADSIKTMRDAAKKESPYIQISGTFKADYEKATQETGQDFRMWLEKDLVDWAVPMAYVYSMKDYENLLGDLESKTKPEWKDKLVPGIYTASRKLSKSVMTDQILYNHKNGLGGTVIFSYPALFTNHDSKPTSKAEAIKTLWMEDKLRDILSDAG